MQGYTLPSIAERDWDLNVHYEVKSNLTAAQINQLAMAGVHSVQPGIESLIDDVLRRIGLNLAARPTPKQAAVLAERHRRMAAPGTANK